MSISKSDMEKQAAEKLLSWLLSAVKHPFKHPVNYANFLMGSEVPNLLDLKYAKDSDPFTGVARAIPFASAFNSLSDNNASPGRFANGVVSTVGPFSGLSHKLIPGQLSVLADAAVQGIYTAQEAGNIYKDQAAQNLEASKEVARAARTQAEAAGVQKDLFEDQSKQDKLKMWLGIGAGALALGGAGYALYSWLRDRSEERASRTRMKMKINTPDGKDAIVDLPINNPELSDKLSDEFNRGVTRTVRRTAKYNSMKLDPETNKYIPYPEWHKRYGNLTGNPVGYTGQEYTQKAANLANMPKYNMVDMFPEKAKDSGIELTRSDKVRKFLDSLDAPQEELNKIAGMQGTQKSQLSEIIGNVTAPLLAGGAATLIANKVFGRSLRDSGILGILAAGATPFIGAAAAGISPTRTPEEQEQHDINYKGWINALIPGASFFNQLQRAQTSKVYKDVMTNTNPVQMSQQKSVVQNKPLIAESDDFDDEDDF